MCVCVCQCYLGVFIHSEISDSAPSTPVMSHIMKGVASVVRAGQDGAVFLPHLRPVLILSFRITRETQLSLNGEREIQDKYTSVISVFTDCAHEKQPTF